MRYNTRYNIRQAQKRGIQVRECGIEGLDTWYRLYAETALRHGMPMQDKAWFSSVFLNQDSLADGVRVKLLMADYEGEVLSAMILALAARRGVYLYGASTTCHKQLMASYALQWEAIRLSKAHGCVEYDLFGCAPNLNRSHPLHGVHVYKKGFGGHIYHRMGCWDYPYQQQDYEVIKIPMTRN